MDEMDYDMSDAPLGQAPTTAPQCPALLPNLNRPTISGSAYDPVHPTSNRTQDFQARHGLSATTAPLPIYPAFPLQQVARDRQPPPNTFDGLPFPYTGHPALQPQTARPGLPVGGSNSPQESSERSNAPQRPSGFPSTTGPQPLGAPWARPYASNISFQRQQPPRLSQMSIQIPSPYYHTTGGAWPATESQENSPAGERSARYTANMAVDMEQWRSQDQTGRNQNADIEQQRQEVARLEQQWRDEQRRRADQLQQSNGAQLPRFATMLNAAWQQPEEEYAMALNTAGRASPPLSQSPSSFASSRSESVASRDSVPPAQSTTAEAAASSAASPSAASTSVAAEATAQSPSDAVDSAPAQQRGSSPNLSHTTLDRTFWEAAGGPPAERGSTDVSASSSPAGNPSEMLQPTNSRPTPPPALASRVPSQATTAGTHRRERASPGHRRSAHSSGGSSRSSDQDSDGSLDTNFASLIEDQTIHNFLGHIHGNAVFAAEYSNAFATNSVRTRQMLRGATSNRRVASKGAIASLVCVDVDSLPESERTCIICYNDFGVRSPEGINEAPLRLPKCKHVFGDHCIKKWFEESDSCPYCRDKVPSEPQFRTNQSAIQHLIRAHQQLGQRGVSRATSPQTPAYHPTIFLGHPQPYVRPAHGERDTAQHDPTSPPFSRNGHGRSRGLGDRRAPPEDNNEGQRRTRPRHGNFRTSAGRSYGAANNSLSGHNSHPHGASNPSGSFSRHGPTQSQPAVPTMPSVSFRSFSQSMSQPSMMHMAPLPAPTIGGVGGSNERCTNTQYRANPSYMWQPSTLYAPSYAAEHPFSVSMSPYSNSPYPYNMAHGPSGPALGPGGAPNRGGYGLQPPMFNSSGPSDNNMPFVPPTGPGGLPRPFPGDLHNRMAAGQPGVGIGAGIGAGHGVGPGAGPGLGPGGLGLSMQPQTVSPPQQAMPTIQSLSNSSSPPLAPHPLLPPIVRDETMSRYMNIAPNTQDNSLPAVTTGWGPS